MSFSGQRIVLADSDTYLTALEQIDPALIILYAGNPTHNLAAAYPTWCVDTTDDNLYFCFQADGTIGGTSWFQVTFNVVPATTSEAGIALLAEPGDTSSTNKILTPAVAAGIYAQQGAFQGITALPVPISQGGTGGNSLSAAIANLLPALMSGQFLTSDGTNLVWAVPGSLGFNSVTTNSTLLISTFNLISADSLALALPAGVEGQVIYIGFTSDVSVGPVITPNGSDKIEGIADTLTCDVLDTPFMLIYTNPTQGWVVMRG
jgi:hypothetical protein